MNENEVTAQKIDQIVNVLKPQVFKELDGRKAKMRHETEYDDSKWNCKVFEGLYLYYPFRLENYEIGSSEYEIIENMRYEDETVKRSVMEILLREWCKKEESARSQERINERIRHMKASLNENRSVADACGISVETVLMIELADKIDILSEDISTYM